jgi:hypothetical protein
MWQMGHKSGTPWNYCPQLHNISVVVFRITTLSGSVGFYLRLEGISFLRLHGGREFLRNLPENAVFSITFHKRERL